LFKSSRLCYFVMETLTNEYSYYSVMRRYEIGNPNIDE
jgi:hypothetical protein